MMAVCCCALAGTAACQHCSANPMATEVWTNKVVTTDHTEARDFMGNPQVGEAKKPKRRMVYRGDVYNAIEAERIKSLDGSLTDRYKDGFHDGLKKALIILANEVDDVSIIPEEGET